MYWKENESRRMLGLARDVTVTGLSACAGTAIRTGTCRNAMRIRTCRTRTTRTRTELRAEAGAQRKPGTSVTSRPMAAQPPSSGNTPTLNRNSATVAATAMTAEMASKCPPKPCGHNTW